MNINHQLVQSRRGGKIHYPGCGARSYYIKGVKGTENMTHEEVVEKYGQQLCLTCFPEARKPKTTTPAETPAPAKEEAEEITTCPGSGTYDWATGKREPERWGFMYSNGGTCAHCNNWVSTTTRYNPKMRKHKA